MGASDSKIQFKSHIVRLFEVPDIPANDPYWIQVSKPSTLHQFGGP